MKTATEKIKELEVIVRETEHFFNLQESYFEVRTEESLQKLRIQSKKVKELIALSKKPNPSLR